MISFSRYILVHEISDSAFIKSNILDGKEEHTLDNLSTILNLSDKNEVHKYVQNVGKNRANIIDVLENLNPDPWICLQKGRYLRAIYTALQVSVAIGSQPKTHGGRILLFLGGPSTIGPGVVASLEKTEIMRAHFDIEEGNEKAKLFEKSCKKYQELANKLILNYLTLDVFGFSTDQFGLGEMK